MRAKRKARRGREEIKDTEEAKRLKVLGDVIKGGRKTIRARRSHGSVTQATFYQLCRALEDPKPGQRADVCFAAASTDAQRRFISDVEAGRQRLVPEQKRIIEEVCAWPSGILDEAFDSEQEFAALCAVRVSGEVAPRPEKASSFSTTDIERWMLRTAISDPRLPKRSFDEPQSPETVEAKPAAKRARRRKEADLRGLRSLPAHYEPLASRAHLAVDIQEALRPSSQEPLRIVAVCGEAGVGKSQLIAEWWRDHGRKRFRQSTFTLDCARLGGDMILESLTAFFLGGPISELTRALTDRINARSDALIVLDGLSDEEGDPALAAGPDGHVFVRYGPEILAASGRADRIALRRVREILIFLGSHDVRASVLLGIQTAEQTVDPLQIEHHLNASSRLTLFRAERLSAGEGAKMMQDRGVRGLSFTDLEHLSSRLKGLPISLAAAAHYLRSATAAQAEAFLSEIDSRGRDFSFFGDFFGRYLRALNQGKFDNNAHPQAYLRLLALMPGPVTKNLIDELLADGRITRLEKASTAKFGRMRIDFVVDQGSHVDVNPMVRGLLRQELARVVDRGDEGATTNRQELHWIHATAARWCLGRLPEDPASFSTVEIEMIEGALYHLLSLRDYLTESRAGESRRAGYEDIDYLLEVHASAEAVTQYCLDKIVRRFLLDRVHRATRFLGQFETKARLLSLFFESLDRTGRPKHLTPYDQATIYGEMGVCWMHAGRLQLAQTALNQASHCLGELGAERKHFEPLVPPPEGQKDLWRLWTETQTTRALIFMRLGRDRDVVEDILDDAVGIARSFARVALDSGSEIDSRQAALLRSARRVLCRKAQVSLNGGDLAEAEAGYQMAADVERLIDGKKLSGDAMRRQIEVLVLRGPCFSHDIALAESLIDAQLDLWVPSGVRRRLSNDIIPMFATKVMLLRAKGEFIAAGKLLREAMHHEFVLRGECSFTARMELALEQCRLLIATSAVTPESQHSLRLIAQELEARHHMILHWDAMLLLAETSIEPERSEILATVERQFTPTKWLRRRTDITILREGGSAVQALGC